MTRPAAAARGVRPTRVCFPFVGDSVGGSHRSAVLLLQNLDPARYVSSVVVHEQGPLCDWLSEQDVPFQHLPLSAYLGSRPGVIASATALAGLLPPVMRFLRGNGIGLVHANDGRMNLTWSLPTRLVGGSFVWHQRSRYAPSGLVKVMMKAASAVICISEFTFALLPQSRRPKAVIVQNPFEFAVLAPMGRSYREQLCTELSLPSETRIIGFVGNLLERKRPGIFIEAAALLKNAVGAPPAFVVFGADRNGTEARLRRKAEVLGIASQLYFMGFRSPIEGWISALDVLLCPQIEEPFGRNLVEAMLMGTPVVAADSGGHREIVVHGDTGFLVTPDEPNAFADAARRLLDDAVLSQNVARAAQAHAKTRYSVSGHVETIMALYDDILMRAHDRQPT